MEISGPLNIGVVDKLDGLGRELHIGFREEFRAYVADLAGAAYALDEDDPDRAGILLQQIAEQLLPHVEAGELSLGDTIVVELGGGGLQDGGSLADPAVARQARHRLLRNRRNGTFEAAPARAAPARRSRRRRGCAPSGCPARASLR